MCVWPHSTMSAVIPARCSRMRSSGVSFSITSVSLRGVAWQKRTRPTPSTPSMIRLGANDARKSRCSRVICLAHQSANGPGISDAGWPSNSSIRPRSALPRTKRVRGSRRSTSMVSAGMGPEATSPQDTMTSGLSRSISSSTASSAGRLPWTSAMTATRIFTRRACPGVDVQPIPPTRGRHMDRPASHLRRDRARPAQR